MKTKLGMVTVAACVLPAQLAVAASTAPTNEEKQISAAFDTAVRSSNSLGALGHLPWDWNAHLINPMILKDLQSCQPARAYRENGKLVLVWETSTTQWDKCPGSLVTITLRKGLIRSALFDTMQVAVTSGQREHG